MVRRLAEDGERSDALESWGDRWDEVGVDDDVNDDVIAADDVADADAEVEVEDEDEVVMGDNNDFVLALGLAS